MKIFSAIDITRHATFPRYNIALGLSDLYWSRSSAKKSSEYTTYKDCNAFINERGGYDYIPSVYHLSFEISFEL